jgi:hypothetical protein
MVGPWSVLLRHRSSTPETVREHWRFYQTAGMAGVERLKYEGSEPALTADQLWTLGAELDAGLYMTAKAVCAWVQRSFAVSYTPHARDCQRLGGHAAIANTGP